MKWLCGIFGCDTNKNRYELAWHYVERYKKELQNLTDKCIQLHDEKEVLQARIDELMWEFCPMEMTPEQIKRYEEVQRPYAKKVAG